MFFVFVKVIFLFNLTSNRKNFVTPPIYFLFLFYPYSFNCILYLRSFFPSNLMTQIMNLEYWRGLKSFLFLLFFFQFHHLTLYIYIKLAFVVFLNFFIELSRFHDLDHGLFKLTQVGSLLITQVTCLSH